MNFASERFKEQIVVNKALCESLATELKSNNLLEGTILLAAEEILFEPNFVFAYKANGIGFPGRYDVIIVANRFNSRGAMIDLRGFYGGDAEPPGPSLTGDKGRDSHTESFVGSGGEGKPGNTGGTGGSGSSIKVFCNELENISIRTDGGNGGSGGQGGKGGDGGAWLAGSERLGEGHVVGFGKAGKGGPGGPGGDAGMIKLLFCKVSDLVSISDLLAFGGKGGEPGPGGEPGHGKSANEQHGDLGITRGTPGDPKKPTVKKVENSELWQRVSIELGLTS